MIYEFQKPQIHINSSSSALNPAMATKPTKSLPQPLPIPLRLLKTQPQPLARPTLIRGAQLHAPSLPSVKARSFSFGCVKLCTPSSSATTAPSQPEMGLVKVIDLTKHLKEAQLPSPLRVPMKAPLPPPGKVPEAEYCHGLQNLIPGKQKTENKPTPQQHVLKLQTSKQSVRQFQSPHAGCSDDFRRPQASSQCCVQASKRHRLPSPCCSQTPLKRSRRQSDALNPGCSHIPSQQSLQLLPQKHKPISIDELSLMSQLLPQKPKLLPTAAFLPVSEALVYGKKTTPINELFPIGELSELFRYGSKCHLIKEIPEANSHKQQPTLRTLGCHIQGNHSSCRTEQPGRLIRHSVAAIAQQQAATVKASTNRRAPSDKSEVQSLVLNTVDRL